MWLMLYFSQRLNHFSDSLELKPPFPDESQVPNSVMKIGSPLFTADSTLFLNESLCVEA